MNKKFSSIKRKTMFLSILVPIALVVIFAGTLFFLQFMQSYRNEKMNLLMNSRNFGNLIYIEISESFELLRNLSVNPMAARVIQRMDDVPSGLDNDDYRHLEEFGELQKLLGRVSEGTSAELVYTASLSSTGIILSRDVQIGAGFDVRGRDYYQGALAAPGQTFISEPRVSAEKTAEPKIVITAAKAVSSDEGGIVGIAALNYSFDPIIAIIRELSEKYGVKISLYDTIGEYILWDHSSEVPYFFDPENIVMLYALASSLGYNDEQSRIYTDAMVSSTEYYFEGNSKAGKAMLQSISIPETRWGIIVAAPKSRVTGQVIATVIPPILIFLVLFLAMQIVVFIIYSKTLVKPLTGIGGHLEDLAAADADLTVEIPVMTRDEIGKVADSFNKFVSKLRILMVEVKTAIDGTDQIKMSVTTSTEETSTAVEQISANLDSIGRQIEILDNNINENVTAIEQVSQNISSMDDQIVNQSAMVEESTSAITEMIASLQSVNNVAQSKKLATEALSAVAGEGKNKIRETAEAFKSVVTYINQVQEMADTINNIAAQTNLLSMNAAIEAAHAGDSGRGFAVVAEEIRKLADSAGKSSQAITQLIKDITASVRITDNNVAATTEAFEKISHEVGDTVNAFAEIEQSVAELNAGGRQILESTNQINEVTVNIRNGSGEIKAGTNVMLDSSTRIKEVSDRVTTGMAESTAGAAEIVRSMQLMMNKTQDLSLIVEELKQNFGQFKTEG